MVAPGSACARAQPSLSLCLVSIGPPTSISSHQAVFLTFGVSVRLVGLSEGLEDVKSHVDLRPWECGEVCLETAAKVRSVSFRSQLLCNLTSNYAAQYMDTSIAARDSATTTQPNIVSVFLSLTAFLGGSTTFTSFET